MPKYLVLYDYDTTYQDYLGEGDDGEELYEEVSYDYTNSIIVEADDEHEAREYAYDEIREANPYIWDVELVED